MKRQMYSAVILRYTQDTSREPSSP